MQLVIKEKQAFPILTNKDMFLNFVVRNETDDEKNKLWSAVCNHERKGIYSGYSLVGEQFIYHANGNGQWIANPYHDKVSKVCAEIPTICADRK